MTVYIFTSQPKKGLSPKLQKLWKGPFRILSLTDTNALVVPVNQPRASRQWINLNRCKIAKNQHTPVFPPSDKKESSSETRTLKDDEEPWINDSDVSHFEEPPKPHSKMTNCPYNLRSRRVIDPSSDTI